MSTERFAENLEVKPWETLDKPVSHYLALLEDLIDPEHQAAVEERQLKAWKHEPIDHLPVILQLRDDVGHKTYGVSDWPFFKWGDMYENWDWMLLNELGPCYDSARIKDDRVFTARPNLGQVPIPALFGCSFTYYKDSHFDTMPWVEKIEDEKELFALLDRGLPDLNGGETDTIRQIVQRWRELLKPFPKLTRFVHVTAIDNQGPFNLGFHLRGQNLYTDVVNNPEMVHKLMDLITETYIEHTKFVKEDILQEPMKEGYYWGYRMHGGVRIVDDNSILLGSEMYKEFVHPYNIRAAEPFNGGMFHFCGLGDHVINDILSNPYNHAVNFGNPEMQDLGRLWPLFEEKKISVLWDTTLAQELLDTIKTGIVIKEAVPSIDEAKRRLELYHKNKAGATEEGELKLSVNHKRVALPPNLPDVLAELAEAILEGEEEDAYALTEEAVEEGLAPQEILNKGMISAMAIVGDRFGRGEIFVPEMLIAARAMKEGLKILRPLLTETGVEMAGKCVLATVKGDIHDIGKNLVGMMLEGAGFEVIDLGVNVDAKKIVDTALEHDAKVIGLSALLTTTMPYMKTVIREVRDRQLQDRIKVMVGGAPLSARYAEKIEADGYGENAQVAATLAKGFLEEVEVGVGVH